MSNNARDAGYDDLLDAIEREEGYYLESPSGRGWLPPRTIDPETGERSLEPTPLPEAGEIETVTVTQIPIPDFGDDAPYAVAIASFGPVRLTGQVRGIDPEDVEIDMAVGVGVDRTKTTGDRLLVFDPR